jgi:signal transduction histidine kinase
MASNHMTRDETNLTLYLAMIEQLERGEYRIDPPDAPLDQLGQAVIRLAHTLETRQREQDLLERITRQINAGLLLDEILERIYDDFRELIPFTRIGLSLIADDGETVTSRWIKSDGPIRLDGDYNAPLTGSSLKTILDTGQPRILNDLEAYLRAKPESHSTRLLVEEGIRASLTCPLMANGVAVGFLFFSSTEPGTYREEHIDLFQRIAAQLSVIIEKGRLVSELTAQKEAIARQNDELQAVNTLKDMFLSTAAHDLRSPLAVIEMAVGVLSDPQIDMADEERSSVMANISAQTRHMANLVDNLLDLSLIEAGRIDLLLKHVDLSRFLTALVADHDRLARAKGSSVWLESDLDASDVARVDPMRLRQVMDNLISNAIKFSPPESRVRVIAERIEAGWQITVQDEGPGISPEERERLFQPFERLSARPTGGEHSTGLGLAITRHLVEAHRGEIGVDSELGQGARFWFTLPVEGPGDGMANSAYI